LKFQTTGLKTEEEPVSSLFDLKGKVAVITGSSKGIGKAIALRMAEHGAKVVVSSRKQEGCEAVVNEIKAAGGEAIVKTCNINTKEALQDLVDFANKTYGKIDILVSNAALNVHFGKTLSATDDQYEKIMGANVRSNFWLCNMVAPQMAARKDGVILIISSVAGLRGTDTLPLYGLSKAADMQMVRNLAVEWGEHNVRANCIAPGLVKTDFAKALWDNPKIYEKTVTNYPLRRIAEPDEIAGCAVMLAAKAGSFITGETIVIDGGGTITGRGA
jgi:NAD(P)-dependent dehydrogenase (short-subunit alcohol dehydrogenase family)